MSTHQHTGLHGPYSTHTDAQERGNRGETSGREQGSVLRKDRERENGCKLV